MDESRPDVTELLLQWGTGDTTARDRLIPLVYQELRKNAAALLARERPGHTLSATALVHEVFLKIVNQRQVSVQNRAHFFGAAGHIMRRVRDVDGERRLDYRRDVFSEMTWTIRPEDTGVEGVDFVFTLNHFFDNVPPTVPPQVIDAAVAAGRQLDRVSAEQSHRYVAMSLRIKW